MLSKGQKKLVRQLLRKKGRRETGKCLVEGKKIINEIGDYIDFTFTSGDTGDFHSFTDTSNSQDIIGVANIPKFSVESVLKYKTNILLDHVQDPGNVGAFFRLARAFDASLILRECADPFSPKVIRASSGACFKVPHVFCDIQGAQDLIEEIDKPVFRMEKQKDSQPVSFEDNNVLLVFGNEGRGIIGDYPGESFYIPHNEKLESLSVSHAAAIALHQIWNNK